MEHFAVLGICPVPLQLFRPLRPPQLRPVPVPLPRLVGRVFNQLDKSDSFLNSCIQSDNQPPEFYDQQNNLEKYIIQVV